MSATLPYGNARCAGHESLQPGQRLRPVVECRDCLRRTAPGREWQPWQSAPEFERACPEKITKESRSA